MTMETYDSRLFARIINSADLITPDGMPLVWALRTLGVKKCFASLWSHSHLTCV